jgi:poly-gamma-glutamate synthesis protein (capsule biosynthesis protein)
VPSWLVDLIGRTKAQADVVVVTPHWGPNMTPAPVAHVRRAPPVLLDAGAALVAGHSAHLFHGVAQGVLYDMGDFIDDYAVDAGLRNDLGLLFLVEIDADGPRRVDAIPLRLEYAHTRMARGTDAEWIAARFMEGCAALGTRVERAGDRLIVRWR